MRRLGIRLVCLLALGVLLAGLGSGSAAAAGNKKLVEGTVYDTTGAAECPPPPHCGPITADRASSAIVCPLRERRIIACPLARVDSAIVCVQAEGCPTSGYPLYSGEGAVIKVRKRGSVTVRATLPVVEGHFAIRLSPGEYVLHPYLAEEGCWSGDPEMVTVSVRINGPIPASLDVSDACVAHPDAATP